MQKQTSNYKSFAKTIEDYLFTIKLSSEHVIRASNNDYVRTGCIFYTDSGISVLDIKPDSFIGIYYCDNPTTLSDTNFGNLFKGKNVVLFVNVEKRFASKMKHSIKVLYLDDLDFSLPIKDNENYVENDNPKGNCIPITKLDEYIRFSIRAQILLQLFRNISHKIYDIRDEPGVSVFPFLYDDGYAKYVLFVDKRDLLKIPYFREQNDRIVYIQFSVNKSKINSNEVLMLATFKETIYFDKTNFNKNGFDTKMVSIRKLDVERLNEFVTLFNRGSRYYVDEFVVLFKYRQFAKCRYSPTEEVVSYVSTPIKYPDSYEICIGSRSAIENNTIWFSNYDSLNDPFDLIIRYPKELTKRVSSTVAEFYEGTQYYDIKKSGILVFCTTKRDDNILMWSHYGDSHKGMCTGYLENEIISTIASDSSVGICFYGKVEYPPVRPVFKITLKELLFITPNLAYFRFNVKNLFSKYQDWNYEREYRFIIVPTNDSYNDYISKGGHPMTLRPFDYVFGYNFSSSFSSYLSSAAVALKKFDISNIDYKLIKP